MKRYPQALTAPLTARLLAPHPHRWRRWPTRRRFPRTPSLAGGRRPWAGSTRRPPRRRPRPEQRRSVRRGPRNRPSERARTRRRRPRPGPVRAASPGLARARHRRQRHRPGPRDPSTAPRVAAPGPGLGRGGRTPAAPQKSPGGGGRGRGARGDRAARQPVITGIAEAGPAGARRAQACQTRGLTRRTVPRWRAVGAVQPDGRAAAPRPIPAQALSPAPGPTGRHRPPSGVDLGEHRPGYDRPRALLLPRPAPRPLQPPERRLGGPGARVRRPGRRAVPPVPAARGRRPAQEVERWALRAQEWVVGRRSTWERGPRPTYGPRGG